MEKTNQIVLVQLPIIKHQLVLVGEEIDKRLSELNIENQVVTEDTVKFMKELRAVLNKEKDEFENQRKSIKKQINAPYDELEIVYKEQITGKYDPAIQSLGLKITEFETKLKEERKIEIVKYFNELCSTEKIDFLTFEKTGIEINLSGSTKSFKDKCNEFVFKVVDDLSLIASEQFQAEILTEYKNTLNVSKSIIDVKARKESENQETIRLNALEIQRRKSLLENIGLAHNFNTRTFNWSNDENVLITQEDVENLSKDEFQKAYIELEVKTKPIEKDILQTPTIEKPKVEQKIITARFEVQGTYDQLKALNEYIKLNNLTFKNL